MDVDTRRATQSQPNSEWSRGTRLKIGFAVSFVLIVGGLASYGAWKYLFMWPPEVRGDLRAALKAKHFGDFELAEQLLQP